MTKVREWSNEYNFVAPLYVEEYGMVYSACCVNVLILVEAICCCTGICV